MRYFSRSSFFVKKRKKFGTHAANSRLVWLFSFTYELLYVFMIGCFDLGKKKRKYCVIFSNVLSRASFFRVAAVDVPPRSPL
jgi:hypothetical protein